MEKVVQKFNSFEEAEAADRAFYKSLSPEERMQILLELIECGDRDVAKALREFFALLNENAVEYLIVGAYAFAYHGVPRYSEYLDLFIRAEANNVEGVMGALECFGIDRAGLTPEEFISAGNELQFGRSPARINIVSEMVGVPFEKAWKERVRGSFDGVGVAYIGKAELMQNKMAIGGLRELADLEYLE